ncbi:Protein of unknown function [Riemerella columbipharyngis]|uniref:DUF445 domain-containing protein n=1 Tax=Riemerella columbipharyngis TaxID=1071918 RepID=A0A1G6YIS0_9FLAO|nr:Protein of unknown function [Riemerella columbipharyngis]
MVIANISDIILDIVHKLDDKSVTDFIAQKGKELATGIDVNTVLSNGILFFVEKQEHQNLITSTVREIKHYVLAHQELIREKVKQESYSIIPKFIDDTLADKITNGIAKYFQEVETNVQHPLRREIEAKVIAFSSEIKNEEKWQKKLNQLKDYLLREDKVNDYAKDIWDAIKSTLVQELSSNDTVLKTYLRNNIATLSQNLKNNTALQYKIDCWVRAKAYHYLLRNTHKFGELISSTMENWQGKELSNKLELEVGKDLQFIRVNGTLVGGIVGLIIHAVSRFL